VEGTVREVKRRVRVVASSYRAIDQSVTRWISGESTEAWKRWIFVGTERHLSFQMWCSDDIALPVDSTGEFR